jgi:hypothetical protein
LTLAALLLAPYTAAADPFVWPNGARAAVSLAYDDALDSQLDHAIPTLDKYGLKGSFYLQLSNPAVDKRLADWRRAAAKATSWATTACSTSVRASARATSGCSRSATIDTTTAAQMQDQVGWGIPCCMPSTASASAPTPCRAAMCWRPASTTCRACAMRLSASRWRGRGDAVDGALDRYAVGVAAPEGLSGAQLIALVQQAAERGTMVNFTFTALAAIT